MPAGTIMRNPAAGAAITIAVVGAAAILGAFYFQYALGLAPCPLCLEQRIAYYVAIPLALILAFAAARSAPRGLVGGRRRAPSPYPPAAAVSRTAAHPS